MLQIMAWCQIGMLTNLLSCFQDFTIVNGLRELLLPYLILYHKCTSGFGSNLLSCFTSKAMPLCPQHSCTGFVTVMVLLSFITQFIHKIMKMIDTKFKSSNWMIDHKIYDSCSIYRHFDESLLLFG